MYPLLLLLILVLVLMVKGFTKKGNVAKTIQLLKWVTLFALVWGFLGQIIGLITAFDFIESVDSISSGVLAAGLKISLLTPAFGAFVFLIGRFGIIVLTWMQKE